MVRKSSKWATLNEQQKSNVAENVAGNRHRSTFLSLMKSMNKEQILYNEALNSTGALEDANDIKAESIQGKMNTFKDTIQEVYASILNSDMMKGGLDIFTGIAEGVKGLITTFGALPTIAPVVVGALSLVSGAFRGLMLTMMTNPIGLTIVGITTACTAGYSAYSSYKSLMDKPVATTSTEDLS